MGRSQTPQPTPYSCSIGNHLPSIPLFASVPSAPLRFHHHHLTTCPKALSIDPRNRTTDLVLCASKSSAPTPTLLSNATCFCSPAASWPLAATRRLPFLCQPRGATLCGGSPVSSSAKPSQRLLLHLAKSQTGVPGWRFPSQM